MRPITAADLMNPELLTVPDDMPVWELAHFLIDNEISGAPVESAEGKLVGVVSLRDIVAAGSEEDEEDYREGYERSDFYARGWRGGDELDELEELEEIDLGDEDLLVEDIMTSRIHSVTPETAVSDVAGLMLQEHLHRVLVIDDGKPVGIISTSDLLGLLVEAD